MGTNDDTRAERFSMCWADDAPRVMAYAMRHVGRDHSQDVVAEVFMVAWRRWEDVPRPALPWLIGTARKVIQNQRRGQSRHLALADRLSMLRDVAADDPADIANRRGEALRRLSLLPEEQQEALLLVSWDGLSVQEAATAAGVREGAFRTRLHRARRALDASSDEANELQKEHT